MIRNVCTTFHIFSNCFGYILLPSPPPSLCNKKKDIMASTVGGVSLSTPTKMFANAASPKTTCIKFQSLNNPWNMRIGSSTGRRLKMVLRRIGAGPPDKLSEKVAESVKAAEEACAGDPVSGECAAAWDEVEELSAAASHKREREKESEDPLENYCKDNPETDECRTYDN